MKKSLLFVVAVVFCMAAKSQTPGFKWKNVDPSLFKIGVLKQKGIQYSWAPKVSQNKNEDIKRNSALDFKRAVVLSPVDGMPCIIVDPRNIDPKMLVKIQVSPLNYHMPNPLIPSPNISR